MGVGKRMGTVAQGPGTREGSTAAVVAERRVGSGEVRELATTLEALA